MRNPLNLKETNGKTLWASITTLAMAGAAFIAIAVVACWALAWCWNQVIPTVFGLPQITWEQALMIYIIVRIFVPSITVNKS